MEKYHRYARTLFVFRLDSKIQQILQIFFFVVRFKAIVIFSSDKS